MAAWVAEASIGGPVRCRMGESVQALADRFGVPVEKLGRLFIVEDAWKAAVGAARTTGGAGPNVRSQEREGCLANRWYRTTACTPSLYMVGSG